MNNKILRTFLCLALLLVATWTPLSVVPVSATPDCYGSSCTGYYPAAMGCGADAETAAQNVFTGGRVQNRYSDACNAEWARTYNLSGTQKYAVASIRYGGANYYYHQSTASPAKISDGEQVHTRMKGPDDVTPALSCGTVSDSGPLSVPSRSHCTGVT